MLNNSTTGEMTTLSDCLKKVKADGYTVEFEARAAGLCIPGSNKCYQPVDISIKNFYRFEGASDPGDNIILYLIHTGDGKKGTVTDAYGIYADSALSNFIQEVEAIKKIKPSKF